MCKMCCIYYIKDYICIYFTQSSNNFVIRSTYIYIYGIHGFNCRPKTESNPRLIYNTKLSRHNFTSITNCAFVISHITI